MFFIILYLVIVHVLCVYAGAGIKGKSVSLRHVFVLSFFLLALCNSMGMNHTDSAPKDQIRKRRKMLRMLKILRLAFLFLISVHFPPVIWAR